MVKVTRELLAAHSVAADIPQRPQMGCVELAPAGFDLRSFATNGTVAVLIKREAVAGEDAPCRAMFLAQHAKDVASTARALGLESVDITSGIGGEAPRLTADFYCPKTGKSLADHSFPDEREDWDASKIMDTRALAPYRARVAVDSRHLAAIAKLRAAVGGPGPVMVEVRGETDPLIVRWEDNVGHEAKVLVAPVVVDEDVWARGLW